MLVFQLFIQQQVLEPKFKKEGFQLNIVNNLRMEKDRLKFILNQKIVKLLMEKNMSNNKQFSVISL